MNLWSQYKDWKKNCRWVDLSREVSADTTHWAGFPPIEQTELFNIEKDGFTVHLYHLVGQYGTHVDAPRHFIEGTRTLDTFRVDEMVCPLCVIDASSRVDENPVYALSVEDVYAYEDRYGKIPERTFVAFRSGWREGADFPGWDLETIRFLVEKRNITAIGHETSDTDPSNVGALKGYPGEKYILQQNRYQVELMTNLDEVPEVGAIIFCTFPRVKGATGFTARCFALCEKNSI